MVNGVPNEYSLTITQTAKGIFYVDKLYVKANTQKELLEEMENLIYEVKTKLEQLNGGKENGK